MGIGVKEEDGRGSNSGRVSREDKSLRVFLPVHLSPPPFSKTPGEPETAPPLGSSKPTRRRGLCDVTGCQAGYHTAPRTQLGAKRGGRCPREPSALPCLPESCIQRVGRDTEEDINSGETETLMERDAGRTPIVQKKGDLGRLAGSVGRTCGS